MSNVSAPRIASLFLMICALPAMAQQNAYVPRSAASTVDVVDRETNTVVASIGVGTTPTGVAVHPRGHRAYIANSGSDDVSVIDTDTNTVVATVAVGDQPRHLAVSPDGATLWVGNAGSDDLSVIDTAGDVVVDTIALADPGAVTFSPSGEYAWVGSGTDVARIATFDNSIDLIAVGGTTEGIAVRPDGTMVYVTRLTGGASTVATIDPDTLAVGATASVGVAQRGVVVDPTGRYVYVAVGGALRVLRTFNNSATQAIPLPDGAGATGVSVSQDGHFIYATNRTTGNLHVISGSTHDVVATLALGGTPLAFGNMVAQPLYGQGSVAAGDAHGCRLRADTLIDCWGDNSAGAAQDQEGGFRALVAGGEFTCAIVNDATRAIECFGDNSNGQTDASTGQFVAIAAGDRHGCGIITAGSAKCWGANGSGQATAPAATERFAGIAAGSVHTCAVRTAGDVICWGGNAAGQSTPVAAAAGEHYLQVVAGSDFSCALQSDGAVVCWGNAANGRTSPPSGAFAALSATANAAYACGRRFDGGIECWGADVAGETNAPAGAFALHAAGAMSGCGLRALGELECWGDNAYNQAPQFEVTPATLADADDGVAYDSDVLRVEIVDPGTGTFKSLFGFGLVDGALPPGLTLNYNRIVGTPTTPGAYVFTVRGEDIKGFHAERTYTITVN